MHKLCIYLNDDQYSKLEALCRESPFSNAEEYANEVFYDWLLYKWLKHKSDQLTEYMNRPGFWDEDEEPAALPYVHDGIYCDGDQAIIEDVTLQRINGKLHYVIITGDGADRVPCNDIAAEQFERILNEHGAKLNDLTWEDLKTQAAGKIEEV